MTGSNSGVGTSDGRIGQQAVRGAVRGTNTYPAFTGKWVMLYPTGAISFSIQGHVVSPGHFAGTATITSGTGHYKKAHGNLTFTASSQQPSGGESHPLIVRKLKGTLILP